MSGALRRLALAGLLGLLAAGLPVSVAGQESDPGAERTFDVRYDVRILPTKKSAEVTIRVSQSEALLTALIFDVDPERHVGFDGEGPLHEEDGSFVWEVPPQGGRLAYTVQIDHLRDPAEYDARCTRDWALFRGTDVVPPVRARHQEGARARARLRVRVPPGWQVVTPFEPLGDYTWRVRQAHRVMDAPRGWMILGELRVSRATVKDSEVVVAAPVEHEVRARDTIAFLRWTLPELERVVGGLPPRILIVSADDPMWRGGLSGPDSLYLHADRPLIDKDGSSPILHELVHVAMRAFAGERGDWVVEGLAEYYSLQILLRSGAVTEKEYVATIKGMRRRGGAKTLFVTHSTGAVTRRAVVVMAALDAEIRKRTGGRASLDDVLKRLSRKRQPLSYQRFREEVTAVVGEPLDGFFDTQVS